MTCLWDGLTAAYHYCHMQVLGRTVELMGHMCGLQGGCVIERSRFGTGWFLKFRSMRDSACQCREDFQTTFQSGPLKSKKTFPFPSVVS